MKISNFIKTNRYLLIALCVLLVYLSPNLFFPQKAKFLIHDNLNSNVVWYKNLAESGKMFASSKEIIPVSLHGIPRGCYPTEFNVLHLFYLIFKPLAAYNLNIIVMHFLAFFSMYFFVRKYIFRYAKDWAAVLISLVFALLPFWPSGAAAITAQPLLLFAFLNIWNKELNWKNWLIIILIPFYSELVLSNLFFMILLFLGFITVSIYKKKINPYFILAMAVFTIVSVLAEYRLFYMNFIEHFQSHREVVAGEGSLNLKGVIGVSLAHFLKGHYHFMAMQTPFILLSALLAICFARGRKQRFIIGALLFTAWLISLILVLPSWGPVARIFSSGAFSNTLNLRFYSLYPLLWFIIFAYSIKILLEKNKAIFNVVVAFFGIVSCICLFFSLTLKDYQGSNFFENSFYATYIRPSSQEFATFDEYYKKDIFSSINKELPPGDYYTACLGISPEIAQFNGYKTIDGYFYYYPASYNHLMEEICRREMDKMNVREIKSHCILLSKDIDDKKKVVDNLELDFDKLRSLGTKYIFSNREVINIRMTDPRIFTNGKGRIFVYTIN